MVKKAFICVCLCLLTGFAADDAELATKIDARARAAQAEDLFSGTILLARHGKLLFSGAYGEADKDHGTPNRLETRFNIGSIGKTFTAVSIMGLVDQGKLSLNDPVKKHLTDFPHGDKIQIRHLLNHSSGINNYMRHRDYAGSMSRLRLTADFKPLIYDQELVFSEPETKFSYSNSGMVLLGLIIEKVSGMTYADYIQTNIFKPLKMNDSGICFREQVVPNRSKGYSVSLSGGYTGNTFSEPPAGPDGGLYTSVGDMLKFDQALVANALLSDNAKENMFTERLGGYGYGWQIQGQADKKIVGHTGGAPGVSAAFFRYLDDGFTVIVLSNYSRGIFIYQDIMALIGGRKLPELPKPLGRRVYASIQQKGLKATIADLEKAPPRGPMSFNSLGYAFMSEGMAAEAIEIFKLNTRFFPQNANAFDSLAEGYMNNGQLEAATENYNKTLAMEPSNPNARVMLQRLEKMKGR